MTDLASIDAWLPQTQCTRCGYADCRDYAEAVKRGDCDIDRCPPGGGATLRGLAELLQVAPPEDIARGLDRFDGYEIATIVESECIGCTKCIEACPVDAILGSGKMMHTVIESACTGCELCIPPCPVDCIQMRGAAATDTPSSRWPDFPADAAERFRRARQRRLRRGDQPINAVPKATASDEQTMRREILDAVARSRRRRHRLHGQAGWTEEKST